MQNKEKKAKRINTSITYKIEKSFLIYLANRLPGFITPDSLTIFALISSIFVGLCFYLSKFSEYWLIGSIFFLICHWFADSLDGTIARVRKIERERFGYFVDHMSDMFATIFIMVGLGASQLMNINLAFLVIIVYFLASINTYLAAYTQGIFKYSIGRIGPTEIRILIILLTAATLIFYPGHIEIIKGLEITIFNLFAILSIIILFILTITSIIKNLKYLNEIDKKKYKEMTILEYLQKNEFINKIKNFKLTNENNTELLNFLNSFTNRGNKHSKSDA